MRIVRGSEGIAKKTRRPMGILRLHISVRGGRSMSMRLSPPLAAGGALRPIAALPGSGGLCVLGLSTRQEVETATPAAVGFMPWGCQPGRRLRLPPGSGGLCALGLHPLWQRRNQCFPKNADAPRTRPVFVRLDFKTPHTPLFCSSPFPRFTRFSKRSCEHSSARRRQEFLRYFRSFAAPERSGRQHGAENPRDILGPCGPTSAIFTSRSISKF